MLTDLLTHWIDVVHWYLGVDAPHTAVATGAKYRIKTMDWPDNVTATLEYPKEFMVTHTGSYASSIDDGGLEFRGDQATLKIDRERLLVYSEASRRTGQPWRATPEPEMVVRSQADGTIAHLAQLARLRPQPEDAERARCARASRRRAPRTSRTSRCWSAAPASAGTRASGKVERVA